MFDAELLVLSTAESHEEHRGWHRAEPQHRLEAFSVPRMYAEMGREVFPDTSGQISVHLTTETISLACRCQEWISGSNYRWQYAQ